MVLFDVERTEFAQQFKAVPRLQRAAIGPSQSHLDVQPDTTMLVIGATGVSSPLTLAKTC